LPHHPGGRAEIDDDALPGGLHARQHGLCREELMLEIHRYPVVPVLRRHQFGRVPFVMRRVVDENRDRPVDLAGFRDARAQRGDIRDVDMSKVSGKSLAGKLPRETDARLVRDIEEDDGRFLAREATHDRFPDAGCATGDQHDFAGEIGIDGDHGFLKRCSCGRRRDFGDHVGCDPPGCAS
jgi:hypothetical protein